MPANKTSKIPRNANQIDLSITNEVVHWCNRFDCTESQLRRAVENVGPSVKAVEAEIRRIKSKKVAIELRAEIKRKNEQLSKRPTNSNDFGLGR